MLLQWISVVLFSFFSWSIMHCSQQWRLKLCSTAQHTHASLGANYCWLTHSMPNNSSEARTWKDKLTNNIGPLFLHADKHLHHQNNISQRTYHHLNSVSNSTQFSSILFPKLEWGFSEPCRQDRRQRSPVVCLWRWELGEGWHPWQS